MARKGPDASEILLFIAGLGLMAVTRRPKRNPAKQSGKSFTSAFRDMGRKLQEVPNRLADEMKKDMSRWQELKERVGDGAHDPGAKIIIPRPDDDIVIEKYGVGIAEDRRNGTFLRGNLFDGLMKSMPSWAVCEKHDNYPCLAVIHGHYSEGWRDDVGPVLAVTITHCHRDSYFPYRDSLYSDEFPLDRFADMLQAAQRSKLRYCVKKSIVVIDNREIFRDENLRLAEQESPAEIRFRNWRGPTGEKRVMSEIEMDLMAHCLLRDTSEIILGEPSEDLTYDDSAKALHDDRTGLSLTVESVGDRDYRYQLGTLKRAGELLAKLTLHRRDCWRPDYGPCQLINLNRAYREDNTIGRRSRETVEREDLPFTDVAPLLNAHPALFFCGEHLGHAVLVDSRAAPLNYYYG